MTARRLLVPVLALLLAAQVVRSAAVAEWAEARPARAASAWKGHPTSELVLAMTEIGAATRDRRPIDPHVFATLDDAARKAPLAPEPFLVRGVQARLAGNDGAAQRAFAAAEWRDPRSISARYFLADHFLRNGDIQDGLNQFAVLARLAPNGIGSVAPYIAEFAKDPRHWPKLRRLFAANPPLQDAVLVALAQNPNNVGALLGLADAAHRTPQNNWVNALLARMVAAGDYAKARATWASISGIPPGRAPLLNDPAFRATTLQSPFNWALASSTVGLAEAQPGGHLHLLFYGQEDGPLARQLLMLAPGTYRLKVELTGNAAQAKALVWSIQCDRAQMPVSTITLDAAAAHGWVFRVPDGCPAQWLQIAGSSSDMPQQSDVTISGIRLTRERTGA